MEINEINEYLPHRYPALFLDRVIDIKPGKSIVGIKNVTINEPIFTGHFPGHAVFPGVFIIEALAQAAGVLGFVTTGKKPADGFIYYLAGIDKVRFKQPVVPGDQIQLEANFVADKRGIWKFSCQATVEGKLVCSADILTAERQI